MKKWSLLCAYSNEMCFACLCCQDPSLCKNTHFLKSVCGTHTLFLHVEFLKKVFLSECHTEVSHYIHRLGGMSCILCFIG